MAQACYNAPYLPASFKGVSFKALDVTSEHGRRGAAGEFPFGERTAYADLGRKIRRYSISAKFDTNDHSRRATLLIAAVETVGPGPLVHPTRGVVPSAACTSLRVRDNPETEQGVTYVDMEFTEANDWPNGLSLVGLALGIAIAPLISQVRVSFSSRYDPKSIPTFREDAVVQSGQSQVEAIVNKYLTASVGRSGEQDRNKVVIDLQSVIESDLLGSQTDVMSRAIALGMTALAGETSGQAKFDIFRDLANGAALNSTFAAPASTSENAIYNLVRVVAAVYMAEASTEIVDGLTSDIFTQADAIDMILIGEMTYARELCDNDLFLALQTFRTEIRTQLNAKAYSSPGLIEFDFGGAIHPVMAAYEIYGNATRIRDIESANGVGRYGRAGPSVVGVRLG